MAVLNIQRRIPLYNPRDIKVKTASYTLTTSDDQVTITPASASVMTLPAISSFEDGFFKTKQYKILIGSTCDYIVSVAANSEDVIGTDRESSIALPKVPGAQIILSSCRIKADDDKYSWDIDYKTEVELKWAGNLSTIGGAAVETFTVPGASTSDLVNVTVYTSGAAPVTILASRILSSNTLEVTFSANPSSDHVISVELFRVTV